MHPQPRRRAAAYANISKVALVSRCSRPKADHTKGIARQSGNVQLDLRDLRTGAKSTQRLKPNHRVDVARLEARQLSLLYADEGAGGSDPPLALMDDATFEMTTVPGSLFGAESQAALREALSAEGAPPLQVKVLYHDGDAVSCALPPHVVAQVAELVGSPMGTAPRLFYRARLEGGLHTKVPHHVAPKDLVVIDAKALHFVRKHEE